MNPKEQYGQLLQEKADAWESAKKHAEDCKLRYQLFARRGWISYMEFHLTLEVNPMDLFTVEVLENEKYEAPSWGDGRSGPWSETKTGKVVKITNARWFFTEDQKEFINKIMRENHSPDHIEWIE